MDNNFINGEKLIMKIFIMFKILMKLIIIVLKIEENKNVKNLIGKIIC